VDATHGNALLTYQEMGRPVSPTAKQIEELRRATQLPPAERTNLANGTFQIQIPSHGLALLEIK
jgi:beta-xylosidase